MPVKAIVLGASGLTGSNLVSYLAADSGYNEIVLLVRRTLNINSPKIRQKTINFDALDEYHDEINGQVVFSCLGTTRSQVSDNEEYYKIDFSYPLEIAHHACKNGAEQFHIVSSLGANKDSRNGYLKLKGELEEALQTIPFKSLHIYRPSFITGERSKKRLTDLLLIPVMKLINPLLTGGFKKYRSIEAASIARFMVKQASDDLSGVFIYESDQIQEIR